MSKTRQPRFPDGAVWVRTYPVTFLHDVTSDEHAHDWHQLSFAVNGHLEVTTGDARRIVPSDRAVWVPAGTRHTEIMRAPISMRSIYIAPGAAPEPPARASRATKPSTSTPSIAHDDGPTRASRAPRPSTSTLPIAYDDWRTKPAPFAASTCRTIAVTPLLREVLLHVCRIGALDRRNAEQARLVGILFDLLARSEDVPLELRMPRDPRARKLAELVTHEPGTDAALAVLAKRAGGSLRTLERCFLAETGVPIGEWRRRMRLFHALRLLETGHSVTDVALEVGYASTSAFSAAFTREFGRSPTGRTRRTA